MSLLTQTILCFYEIERSERDTGTPYLSFFAAIVDIYASSTCMLQRSPITNINIQRIIISFTLRWSQFVTKSDWKVHHNFKLWKILVAIYFLFSSMTWKNYIDWGLASNLWFQWHKFCLLNSPLNHCCKYISIFSWLVNSFKPPFWLIKLFWKL